MNEKKPLPWVSVWFASAMQHKKTAITNAIGILLTGVTSRTIYHKSQTSTGMDHPCPPTIFLVDKNQAVAQGPGV
jgi:hypothetical protein